MMKKAVKYLQNAKEILKNAPSEGNFYADKKLVQKAFVLHSRRSWKQS